MQRSYGYLNGKLHLKIFSTSISPYMRSRRFRIAAMILMHMTILFGISCVPADSKQEVSYPEWPGVNMTLVPQPHEMWSVRDTDDLLKLNETRISQVVSGGFRTIRIGTWSTPWIEAPSKSNQIKILHLLQSAINRAMISKLTIVITFFVPSRQTLCNDPDKIAAYYGALQDLMTVVPDADQIWFEPMNEPATCSSDTKELYKWEGVQKKIYAEFRDKYYRAGFVVAGNEWGSLDGLLRLKPSDFAGDKKTIFTFHYYEPFAFTHQGMPWLRKDHANKYFLNIYWPYNHLNLSYAIESALKLISEDISDDFNRLRLEKIVLDIADDYREKGTRAYLDKRFDQLANWLKNNQLENVRVLMGEFGVHMPPALNGEALNPWGSAPIWLESVRQKAEFLGIGWAVWDLDSGFAVICGQNVGLGTLCPAYRRALGTP